MNTKWWHFSQNNSGGSFGHDPDRGIGYSVFVEAHSADEASARAQDIGIYFDGVREGLDCECCGDRWSEPWGGGDTEPNQYGRNVRPASDGESPTLDWGIPSYIHPIEGRFSAAVIEELDDA